jgi:hypothetical protein
MGFEDEVEQSFGRSCRQTNDRSKPTCELTRPARDIIPPLGGDSRASFPIECEPQAITEPDRTNTGEAGADGAGLGITKSADKKIRPLSDSRPPVRPPGEPTQTEFMMANDLR